MGRGGGGNYDESMAYKFGYDRKWANDMEGLQGAAGVSVSLGVGGQQAEVSPNTCEYNGVTMATSDELYFLLNPRKWDCDFSRDIQALIGFQLTTGADTGVLWDLHMKGVAVGQALSDAKASADATKAFPAVSGVPAGSVNDGLLETVWASMNCAGLFVGDSMIQCAVTLTNSGDAAGDEIRLLYVDFRYSVSLLDPNGPFQT